MSANNPESSRIVSASAVAFDGAGARAAGAVEQAYPLNATARAVAGDLARAPLSPGLIGGFARLIEFLGVIVCGAAIYGAYVVPNDGFTWWYAAPLLSAAFLAVLFIEVSDGYSLTALRRGLVALGKVYLAWAAVFALFAVVAFLAKSGDDYSRVWAATWFATGIVFFTTFRLSFASVLRRWTKAGVLERRAVIVGGGDQAEDLIRALKAQPDNDIRICGIFDDRKDSRSPANVGGYPKLGTVAELVEFARIARIDLLIVSLPITAESRLLQLLKKLWVLPVDIRLSAHTNRLRFRPRSYSFIGAVPFLDVFDKPIADWDSILKRAFDLTLASVAILLLSPVMLATAIAIKLDSRGPVLFKQKRYGFNNELIEVYKFRSMYTDLTDSNASRLVTRDDPRVTRVGRFIRKTSIDELPQLFNVVRGSLSLVGPRPHALQAKAANRLYDEVVDGYFARHRVKPGITGWAQINGWRGETDTAEKIQHRVDHDLYYIENWSVLFDLKICLLTPLRLLSTEQAY